MYSKWNIIQIFPGTDLWGQITFHNIPYIHTTIDQYLKFTPTIQSFQENLQVEIKFKK